MTRGIGLVDAVQGLLPAGAGDVLALLTQLGDVWFLVALLALVYWFHDREHGAFAILTLLGGLALVVGLKSFFGLPRPPPAMRLVGVDGFGFPSGHAIAATVGWGALAVALDRPTRSTRYGIAVAAVLLVSFTRVALGVHFAIDVVAGMAVGVSYLFLVTRVAGRDVEAAGLLAAAIALVGVILSTGASDAVLLFGGVVGGLLTWRFTSIPQRAWQREGALPAAVGGSVVAATVMVGYGGPIVGPVAFLIGVGAVAVVIGLPAASERIGIGPDRSD